ncbi:MAG: hypothetical protein QG650_311 [Patescibacteria group bacterium]|nr:hypothetical protein [Patescibacteria group bacterium]
MDRKQNKPLEFLKNSAIVIAVAALSAILGTFPLFMGGNYDSGVAVFTAITMMWITAFSLGRYYDDFFEAILPLWLVFTIGWTGMTFDIAVIKAFFATLPWLIPFGLYGFMVVWSLWSFSAMRRIRSKMALAKTIREAEKTLEESRARIRDCQARLDGCETAFRNRDAAPMA